MRRRKIRKMLLVAGLFALLLFILTPVFWAVTLSFDRAATTSVPEFSLIPRDATLFNYQAAGKLINLARYYRNTVFLTLVNTAISVFFALCCGYAFAKGRFALKKFWFYFMLAVMMIPFESRMIPLYIQYKNWGMIDTYAPLILGNFAYVYGIFFARQNIAALPDSSGSRLTWTGRGVEDLLSHHPAAVQAGDGHPVHFTGYRQLERLSVAPCGHPIFLQAGDLRGGGSVQCPGECDLLRAQDGGSGTQRHTADHYVPVFTEVYCAEYCGVGD